MRLFSRRTRDTGHPPVEISEKHGVRYLHLGGDAVQSAMRIREPFALELEYTRAMMAFLMLHPDPHDIALVGLGGGSIAKFIHRNLTALHLTALEVNPEVVAAAHGYFLLPENDDRLEVRVDDGAAYVRAQSASLDVLMLDGYDAKRIVAALATPEFFCACRDALRPGGLAVFNLWGTDEHFETYWQRISAVFEGRLLKLPAEKKGNVVVFAIKAPQPDLHFAYLYPRAEQWRAALGLEFPRFLDRMRDFNPIDDTGFVLGAPAG